MPHLWSSLALCGCLVVTGIGAHTAAQAPPTPDASERAPQTPATEEGLPDQPPGADDGPPSQSPGTDAGPPGRSPKTDEEPSEQPPTPAAPGSEPGDSPGERPDGAGADSPAQQPSTEAVGAPTSDDGRPPARPTDKRPVNQNTPAPDDAPATGRAGGERGEAERAPPADSAVAPHARERGDETPPPRLPPGGEQRPTPNYDGREPPPTTAGEVFLWVPRVALFPLYLVSEYVVRRPLGLLVTTAEEQRWLAVLGDFLTFDEARKVGIVPTAYVEFGLEPSVGAYFFADDTFADRNDLRIQVGMWPDDWWNLSVLDRWRSASERFRVEARGNYLKRPDYLYYGLGPYTRSEDRTRYAATTIEGELAVEGRPWRASILRSELGVRDWRFSADTDFTSARSDFTGGGDIALSRALADPNHPISELPPGFASGYTAAYFSSLVALDSRRAFPAPGDGVRLDLAGEYAHDLADGDAWINASGAVGGFVDLGAHRVTSLSAWAAFAEPISGEVPFNELPTIGGFDPMPGFFLGRARDRSRAGATIEYRWPVWIWVDMALHYSVGNVFGPGLQGFDPRILRSSFGLGLRSARSDEPDHSLQFVLAFGTETFAQGASIDTVRLVFGGSRGF